MIQTKNNLGPEGPAIGYVIRDNDFSWTGESALTASKILTPALNEDGRHGISDAEEFLKSELSSAPQPAAEIKAHARQLDFTETNLRTARRRLRVLVFKEGGRVGNVKQRWMWELPPPEDVT